MTTITMYACHGQWVELRVAKGNSLRANVARFCKKQQEAEESCYDGD
ncbi:MAG: hypothetical protein MJE68_21100 [Proteobacteria bacterium]|nr:hypothetical protein [Pseudomonadota bacterium]